MSTEAAGWLCIATALLLLAVASDWRPFVDALRLRRRARRMRKAVRP